MANLQITKGWSDGNVLTDALLDTAMDDISTWLNARDNATDSWLNVSISATTTTPLSVTSSGSTTTVKINNTATDGDPKISFQLSGSETHSIFVDDSDSDYLKFSVSGGVCFQLLPGATPRIEVKDGSAVTPSITFISDVQTGPYRVGSAQYGISIAGTGQVKFTDGTFEPITDNDVSLGTVSGENKRWSDVRSVLINGADYGFANGWILREYPCTYEDVQTKSNEWMKEHANQGIQVINDLGETVAVIGRDGVIKAKAFEIVSQF